jgi:hypothetical protein
MKLDKALVPEISIDEVVEGWVKQYKSDQQTALRNLINFVIRVSWTRASFSLHCLYSTLFAIYRALAVQWLLQLMLWNKRMVLMLHSKNSKES